MYGRDDGLQSLCGGVQSLRSGGVQSLCRGGVQSLRSSGLQSMRRGGLQPVQSLRDLKSVCSNELDNSLISLLGDAVFVGPPTRKRRSSELDGVRRRLA
jgi:hypothetical protein